jgi:DNA-binding CsgD family transcriptional regulator
MGRLERDAEAVTDVAVAALTPAAAGGNLVPVLVALLRVVDADAAGLYQHELAGWTTPLFFVPDEVWSRLPFGSVPTLEAMARHAGVATCCRVRPDHPFTVTDVVPPHARPTPPVPEGARPDGRRRHQLVLPVYTGQPVDTCWAWTLERAGRDFSAPERHRAGSVLPVLDQLIRQRVAAARWGGVTGHDPTVLTEREVVVLRMLATDLHCDEIGRLLRISARTVQKHTERIYRKLSVSGRFQAVQAAADLGLVSPLAHLGARGD